MQRIATWLGEDPVRCRLLLVLAGLQLPDAWLAAGFVRNLVWDRLHGYPEPTPLADLDVIHFGRSTADPSGTGASKPHWRRGRQAGPGR